MRKTKARAKTDGDVSRKKSENREEKQDIFFHLRELRQRFFYALGLFVVLFLTSFFYAKQIFNVLMYPLTQILGKEAGRGMIYTAMQEQFLTEIKLAMFSGLLIALPLMCIQIWLFVAPGLYRQEKSAMLPFLLATPLLFYLGASFVYFAVLPLAWKFFLGFEQASAAGHLAIRLEPKVSEYLSLVMRLILAFGVCFELPVLLMLLVRAGITSAEALRKKRRYAILLAVIVAAILTPPDPFSQLALAIPIILLYEASIWGSHLMVNKKSYKNR